MEEYSARRNERFSRGNRDRFFTPLTLPRDCSRDFASFSSSVLSYGKGTMWIHTDRSNENAARLRFTIIRGPPPSSFGSASVSSGSRFDVEKKKNTKEIYIENNPNGSSFRVSSFEHYFPPRTEPVAFDARENKTQKKKEKEKNLPDKRSRAQIHPRSPAVNWKEDERE